MSVLEIIFGAIPVISMIFIWYNNSLKQKNLLYWIILIIANFLWIFYCGYIITIVEATVIKSGMVIIIVDNIVSIGIAVYGLHRFLKK